MLNLDRSRARASRTPVLRRGPLAGTDVARDNDSMIPDATDPFVTDPVLARAVGYPYDITTYSFTLIDGVAAPFDPNHRRDRRPVIGYGSNQSPIRLRQKYGTEHAPIPVQRAWLADHDVVYSAHFASYGSLPAALRHVPGTRVAVAVNWLSDVELEVMHPTEVDNYHFARLDDLTLELDGGEAIDVAWAYLSFRGHVGEDTTPFALTEVAAENRQLTELSQLEVLTLMRNRLAPDDALDVFVRAHIDDQEIRATRARALEAAAVPVAHAIHKVERV
ncbi:MAG TPA: hypothetical protein DIT35_05700 [Rhodospirillaceae bacterium]|nr:hypothetical protein [Rhodospirillaceae bacterium]